MTQDQDINLKNKKFNEKLKALHSKLGSISWFLTTMRSDNTEEYKKNSHDLKILMKQVNIMRKSMEIYFVVMLILMFFMIQKMLWNGSSTSVSLLANLLQKLLFNNFCSYIRRRNI